MAGPPAGRWGRVAFLTGELAAAAGIARSANPHPAGSPPGRSWLAGWRARTGTALPPVSPAARRDRRPVTIQEGPIPMDMIEKLPGMTDDDLGTLIANAERLAQSGTAKQKQAAAAMLPTIQAEAIRRRDLKPVKRPARGGRKAAAAAPAQDA